MKMQVSRDLVPLSAPFTITGYTFTDVSVVVAAAQRPRRARRRRSGRRLLPEGRRRPHVRRDRRRAPRYRSGHRPRIAAPAAAAWRRAQCARLRALGPRGQAFTATGLAARGTRAAAAAGHDLHDLRRRTRRDGQQGDRVRAGEIAQAQADRSTCPRCRARARGAQGAPRRLARRRCQPGLRRRRVSRRSCRCSSPAR